MLEILVLLIALALAPLWLPIVALVGALLLRFGVFAAAILLLIFGLSSLFSGM